VPRVGFSRSSRPVGDLRLRFTARRTCHWLWVIGRTGTGHSSGKGYRLPTLSLQRAVGLMGIKWSLRFKRPRLPCGLGVVVRVRVVRGAE
jgi:hypothetical protein